MKSNKEKMQSKLVSRIQVVNKMIKVYKSNEVITEKILRIKSKLVTFNKDIQEVETLSKEQIGNILNILDISEEFIEALKAPSYKTHS